MLAIAAGSILKVRSVNGGGGGSRDKALLGLLCRQPALVAAWSIALTTVAGERGIIIHERSASTTSSSSCNTPVKAAATLSSSAWSLSRNFATQPLMVLSWRGLSSNHHYPQQQQQPPARISGWTTAAALGPGARAVTVEGQLLRAFSTSPLLSNKNDSDNDNKNNNALVMGDDDDNDGGDGSSPVPTLQDAMAMPITYRAMDNTTLVLLGRLGDHLAHKEILKRHIMAVDKVSYGQACLKFQEIEVKNHEGRYLLTLPYRVGIAVALLAGFASFPLVFHLPSAEWFNEYFVTTDIPEQEDLETALEVGAWTWNWMEPPLGQISFFLLCLQFSRSQMDNLGIKPYTARVKRWRGAYLASLFPQYDERVVRNYSESSKMAE